LTDGPDQPEFVFHGLDQPANLELVIRNVSLDGWDQIQGFKCFRVSGFKSTVGIKSRVEKKLQF
jgi:hypothetical protein